LKRGGISFRRGVDAEDVAQLDRQGQVATSAVRDGARPRSVVATPTRRNAASA
jgi:hypothetical protein